MLRSGGGGLAFVFLVALLGAFPAAGEVVHLKNGRHLEGEVLAVEGGKVSIRTALGTLSLPESMVERIDGTESLLEMVERTLARLPAGDADGVFELARQCRDRGATTLARTLFERVLEIDSEHAGARRELGHVRHEGRWMTEAEARAARGEVFFRGRLMSAEASEQILARESFLESMARADARRREQQRQRAERERAAWEAEEGTGAGYAYGAAGQGQGFGDPLWGIPLLPHAGVGHPGGGAGPGSHPPPATAPGSEHRTPMAPETAEEPPRPARSHSGRRASPSSPGVPPGPRAGRSSPP